MNGYYVKDYNKKRRTKEQLLLAIEQKYDEIEESRVSTSSLSSEDKKHIIEVAYKILIFVLDLLLK